MTEAEPLSLVAVLNDADAGQKQKLTALATLAELASSDARRDEVFFAMQQIDKAFEQTLVDKEVTLALALALIPTLALILALALAQEGHKLYGTSLGRLHELMLCLLLRSTAYAFTSAQLLEFARGDLPLALSIVGALLRVPTYEDALVGCALGLLRGFFRPDTYTKFWLPGEQSIRAFPKRVETFSAELLRSKLLQAAVPPLAARLFGSGGDLRLAPLSQWPQPRAALAASFLRLVGETYLISWGCSRDQLRADLAAASSTVESLLLPLLRSAALEPVSAAPPPSLLRAAPARRGALLLPCAAARVRGGAHVARVRSPRPRVPRARPAAAGGAAARPRDQQRRPHAARGGGGGRRARRGRGRARAAARTADRPRTAWASTRFAGCCGHSRAASAAG